MEAEDFGTLPLQARIRRATPDDLSVIKAVHLEAMREPIIKSLGYYDVEANAKRVEEHFDPSALFIIERFRESVGTIAVEELLSYLYVSCFALFPAYQRAGIGRPLMQSVFDHAKSVGKDVLLSVLKNTDAIRFYERMGMERTDQFVDKHQWFYVWRRDA